MPSTRKTQLVFSYGFKVKIFLFYCQPLLEEEFRLRRKYSLLYAITEMNGFSSKAC